MRADFAAAEQFMLRDARLLDRLRFAQRFHDGSAEAVVAALHKHGSEHAWLRTATEYVWLTLESGAELGADDTLFVLTFLGHVPDRARAQSAFNALVGRIDELVALDPEARGYVKTPLDFAPRPDTLARALFDDATIELHLDALEAKQQDDGGWPITWEPPSVAAVNEWRGYVTLRALDVLDRYGRLAT